MMGMVRFGLKDVLRGMTLAALGFGMLAIAFNGAAQPTSKEISLTNAFLVAVGGMLVGYGLAFPFKWPPHQMVLALTGMFAAQAWQSGSIVGLLVYVGLLPLLGLHYLIQNLRVKHGRREQ
jgi:hypothetical protein